MKAIIFGVTGQDGYYLSKLLERENVEVIGISTSNGNFTKGDVSDFNFVEDLIKKSQPDYIFHFAAISSTSHDFLFENHKAISTGTLNILESSRLHCPQVKIFLSGSAMQFNNTGTPIDENTPFKASSPYSVARIQSVYAGRYFHEKFNMDVYVGYFFNHDSPLRAEKHINKKITEAIKRISNGSEEKIKIGDLEAKKEFNFAGDIVEAIWILVNQKNIYEVVIGSGKAYSVKEFIEYCFLKTGKDWHNYVTINTAFIPEYKILVSNPKLIESLEWKPKVNFEQLADMMISEQINNLHNKVII